MCLAPPFRLRPFASAVNVFANVFALALRPLPLVDVASPQTQAVKQEAACVAADCQGWCSEHFRESHCSNRKCQCPFCGQKLVVCLK